MCDTQIVSCFEMKAGMSQTKTQTLLRPQLEPQRDQSDLSNTAWFFLFNKVKSVKALLSLWLLTHVGGM